MNDTRQEGADTLRGEVTANNESATPTLYASAAQSLLGTLRRAGGVRTANSLCATEQKILQGAIAALARRGSRTLSMRDIAHSAHVSRGTLYRYFATKEDVLRAVSEFISASFEQRLTAIAEHSSDPLQRLQAVMALQLELANEKHIARIGEIEPGLVLAFLRSHFDRHARAMQNVLTPLFDLIEQRIGITLDRDLFTAALLRVHLSTVIVPADAQWDGFPQVLTELLRALMCGTRPSKARTSLGGTRRSLKLPKAETLEE
jgi:AcrR family transcriptional regulator